MDQEPATTAHQLLGAAADSGSGLRAVSGRGGAPTLLPSVAGKMETTWEDITKLVGDKGRWQYRVFLFTWLEGILIGFHHLASSFLGHVPEHWCSTEDTLMLLQWIH